MGNLLEKPVLEKSVGHGENDYLSYGFAGMQGYRTSMEDRHSTVSAVQNLQNTSFFAVFDGHGSFSRKIK